MSYSPNEHKEDSNLVDNEEINLDCTTDSALSYTVDDAIRHIGLGRYHLLWVPIIASSGFTQSSCLTLPTVIMVNLKCLWDLSTFQEVLVLLVIFLGNIPGDLISGVLSDRRGRKVCLITGQIFLLCSVLLTMLSPNYKVFVFFYFIIGMSIGMLTFVVIIHLSEISPPHFRSSAITIFYVSWALGALFTTLVAFLFLNSKGWKIVTLIVAIPVLLNSILMCFIHESPKFLSTSGRVLQARRVLASMARMNRVNIPISNIEVEKESRRGLLSDVFQPEFRKNVIILCVAFFTAGVIVYSDYSMLPFIFQDGYCSEPPAVNKTVSCAFSEQTLKETTMITTAETLMIPIAAFICEKAGRLPTIRVLGAILSTASFLLMFCISKGVFFGSLFIQRGAVQSLFLILYIYTPECFPTYIRGSACGVILSFMTIGGLISSLIVYPVGVVLGFKYLLIILATCGVAAFVTIIFLKQETQGSTLQDTRTKISVLEIETEAL